jgi:hypothetical protein
VTGGFQADEFGVTSVQDLFATALRLGGGQEGNAQISRCAKVGE